ncbi:hypothetical protein I305_03866 [Cryptococcus gattii E566]|uniref:TAT-binding protein-like protein 7 n=2 Tax=Cryptococcus gattii TaxID=37769 RepID=E6R4M4_CRYGW|nr:TAT-binding protein-like protein 7 [Cryptococcus gattii WM276]ADV22009.1 TAT-binding protein-like protein 7 [Cryptococcus gattii WM276]KIR80432.1 hypothetical protein I306_02408 [Cryptococcus gattii EJB2]KIY33476.1 hypothetical protein I305_03866 [Cryptococcus gattii E566]KJE00433.1 hypothetical protein I311_05977 [Cryptococcus gattii NT-10]
MSQIMAHIPQAPIGELIKTPSKTQTVKRTRAATAAAKEKTQKIKGLNAQLVLSPSSRQTTRPALSPLQFGSRNANVSNAASPSPIKSKPVKASTPSKSKAKRGRPKKAGPAMISDENASHKFENKKLYSSSAVDPEHPFPPSHQSKLGHEKEHASPIKIEKAPKSKQIKAETIEKITEVPIDRQNMDADHDETPLQSAVDHSPAGEPHSLPTVGEIMDMDIDNVTGAEDTQLKEMIEVKPELDNANQANAVLTSAEENALDSAPKEEGTGDLNFGQPKEEAGEETRKETAIEDIQGREPTINETAGITGSNQSSHEMKEGPVPHTEFSVEVSPKTSTTESNGADTAVTSSTQPATVSQSPPAPFKASFMESSASSSTTALSSGAVPIPVRQVRSSWLSKALGTGTVPISNASGPAESNPAICKPFTAPSQQRPSAAMDFSGLRKSLLPIGGLKRKSGEGMGGQEEEDEGRRPDKFTKISSEPHDFQVSTTPGPMGRPKLPSKTPSFGTGSVNSNPASQSRSALPSGLIDDSHRPEISKVTKALDELREKTAKDLAKQKASSTGRPENGNVRAPKAKSTGAGFLRGLLNFGSVSEEEEAIRRARELEEEKIAEAELEKLMWNATKPVLDVESALDDPAADAVSASADPVPQQEGDNNAGRSTTPSLSPPPRLASLQPPQMQPQSATTATNDEDEEMFDEESVLDEIIPAEIIEPVYINDKPQQPSSSAAALPAVIDTSANPVKPSVSTTPVQERPSISLDRREKGQSKVSDINAKKMEKAKEQGKEHDYRGQGDTAVEKSDDERKTNGKSPVAHEAQGDYDNNVSDETEVATSSTLNHASTMAAKALGVRPATGPVKSLQLAAAAAKKEQNAASRKAAMRDQADKRKELLAQKKAEEERLRADEERKAKIAELEEKRRLRAEHEKRKKEREARVAAIAKERAAKEEKEMQAAKAKAEEEAARKRKLTVALNKSQSSGVPASKRLAGPSQSLAKGKESFRPAKTTSTHPLSQSTTEQQAPKAFRTAETTHTQSSTITLVKQTQRESQVERKPLGQPSRLSAMGNQAMRQPQHQQNQIPQRSSSAAPQNWTQVQTSLDEKALAQQSEDIVLPDIASEYSDPDEDTTRDFDRPAWAESPELRKALEAQAHINPDELFGPIKPLNMDELFKARAGKFRARTSSANWSRGDGLTRAEEVDYARRMGFTSLSYYDDAGGNGSHRG